MQTDGNLCIYPREGVQNPVWCSGTASGTSARYAYFLPPFSYGREFGFVLSNSQGQMVWGKFGKPLILDSAYILVPGSYLDRLNPNKNSLTIGKFITNGRDYLAMGIDGAIRLHKDWQGQTTKWISPIPTSEGPYTFGFQEDSNICLKGSNQNQNPTFCTGIKSNAPRYIHIPLLDSFNESFWAWVSYDSINVLSSGYFNLPSDKRFTKNPHISTPFYGVVNSDIDFGFVDYGQNKLAPNGGFLGISKRFNTIRRLSPETRVAGNCYMFPLNDIVPYGYQTYGTWADTSIKLIAQSMTAPCYARDGPKPTDLPPVELIAGVGFEYAFAGTGYNSLIFIDSNGKMLNHFDI
ncbi:hypothetical protein RB653_008674 [Dictyostelium firmibasis]|uniref:Bulb-type lectin domain-containing protein n=1 Tax=Dictyostelium firmibasis TaxID=79012 RepID=A0AAN7U0Y8_9MYCE